MRFPRQRGSTSVMVRILIPDNTSSTGAGLTGLLFSSTNLAIAYSREKQNGFTQITGANLVDITTIGTWASPGTGKLGFKAVDATNYPGLYEIHFPDDAAAFGTGDTSQNVIINVLELTTAVLKIGPNGVLIPLVPWDYQDGFRMGLTALPNVVPGAAGGVFIAGSNAATTVDFTGDLSGSVGSVVGDVGGDVIGSVASVVGAVGSVAPGGITAASFDAGAIDATAIAADAIGASELAADAVTEIVTAILAATVEAAAGAAPAFTIQSVLKQLLGMSAGETSGMATATGTVKNPAGTKSRVVATIDADGNRAPTAWDNS